MMTVTWQVAGYRMTVVQQVVNPGLHLAITENASRHTGLLARAPDDTSLVRPS